MRVKTAVLGSGFLGRHFLSSLRETAPDTIGTTRQELDLRRPDISALHLSKKGFRAAILVGGITGVARCEQEMEDSRQVNVGGTIELIRQLHGDGIKPVFFSSDYVFQGNTGGYSDEAPRNPTTEYGRQKKEVEDALHAICGNHYLILRLSKVFSLRPGEDDFLNLIASNLSRGSQVRAAYDQIFCPTLVDDVIRITLSLIANDVRGTLNLCAPEPWSRWDLVSRLAKRMQVTPSLVVSTSLSEIDDSCADRPKNTSMVPERLKKLGNCDFTPLEHCLERFTTQWNTDKRVDATI